MPTAGYSGTPLAKKLGYEDGMSIHAAGMPDSVRAEIAADIDWLAAPQPGMAAAHLFVMSQTELVEGLTRLFPLMARDGMIWVSWPKKASKVATDMTEDAIRNFILPDTEWVDVKVCAVDETWSGLKLMIRKELR